MSHTFLCCHFNSARRCGWLLWLLFLSLGLELGLNLGLEGSLNGGLGLGLDGDCGVGLSGGIAQWRGGLLGGLNLNGLGDGGGKDGDKSDSHGSRSWEK